LENLAGIFDVGSRMVNPEKFSAALADTTPSQSVEDRRGQPYTPPSMASNLLNFLDRAYNPLNPDSAISSVAGKISRAVMGDRAPAGSLAAQAGYNDLGTSGGLVGGIRNILGIGGSTPSATTPSNIMTPASSPAPAAPAAPLPNPESLARGSADVKGKSGKAGKSSAPPKGLEALLPMLAMMQGGGAGGPPAGPPAGSPPTPGMKKGSANVRGFKKGSANVKGKGGKASSSKGGEGGGDQPGGLEGLLAALAAAHAGAAGPQAANGMPPPMAPGAAAPPGFARGTSSAMASQVRGYAAGGEVQMVPPVVPPLMPMTMPRLAEGTADVLNTLNNYYKKGLSANPTVQGVLNRVPGSQTLQRILQSQAAMDAMSTANTFTPSPHPGFARGTPSVETAPNYPFGAGYLFGAPTVPGEGTGTVDTVPAMLAPHEAVLNRAAADMLGRGLIASLNSRGARQMGIGRGAT